MSQSRDDDVDYNDDGQSPYAGVEEFFEMFGKNPNTPYMWLEDDEECDYD